MKSIWKVLIIISLTVNLFAILFISSEASKNEPANSDIEALRQEKSGKSIDNFAKNLGLTEMQKKEAAKIMEEGWGKVSEEKQKMRDRVYQIVLEMHKKIAKLLTPEQLEKFKTTSKKFEQIVKEKEKK
ncbi:MAG: hypothetical protein A2252_06770 [Elusimicrobia bacterium RIFOXYA2_FULL_39_19]|nr:MAG: hypothetical protein A2252_06770 [Elusimicrobia bacterium RIFOXYA2_FULL_39_19]